MTDGLDCHFLCRLQVVKTLLVYARKYDSSTVGVGAQEQGKEACKLASKQAREGDQPSAPRNKDRTILKLRSSPC